MILKVSTAQAVVVLFVSVLANLAHSDGVADSRIKQAARELEASGNNEQNIRDKYFNHCDQVFHCVSSKVLWIEPEEVRELREERFTFALKDGELITPNKRTLLGDGTANYTLTNGGCSADDGTLSNGPFGEPWFIARMFDDKWVEFRGGHMYGVDAQGDSTSGGTLLWYADCENFD